MLLKNKIIILLTFSFFKKTSIKTPLKFSCNLTTITLNLFRRYAIVYKFIENIKKQDDLYKKKKINISG